MSTDMEHATIEERLAASAELREAKAPAPRALEMLPEDEPRKAVFRRLLTLAKAADEPEIADAADWALQALHGSPQHQPFRVAATRWADTIIAHEASKGVEMLGSLLLADYRATTQLAATARLFDLDRGAFDWNATEIALDLSSWGNAEVAYSVDGRPGLTFGRKASAKTLIQLRKIGGRLGLPGFESLLGLPVKPLDLEDLWIFFAVDGPGETAASAARLTTSDGEPFTSATADRLRVYRTFPKSDDPGTVAAFLRQLEEREGRRIAGVTIDNLHKAYGAVSQAARAAFAGESMGEIEADGRALDVTTQALKGTRPKSEADAMFAEEGLNGMGGIISLYAIEEGNRDGSKPTRVELRHHKGPGHDSAEAVTFHVDLPTGEMWRTDSGPSDQHLEWAAVLPDLFTLKIAAEAWGNEYPAAEKRAKALAVSGLVKQTDQKDGKALVWKKK